MECVFPETPPRRSIPMGIAVNFLSVVKESVALQCKFPVARRKTCGNQASGYLILKIQVCPFYYRIGLLTIRNGVVKRNLKCFSGFLKLFGIVSIQQLDLPIASEEFREFLTLTSDLVSTG